MGDFLESFVEGFATTLNTGITKRQDQAAKFFEDQVELARTVGVKNKQRVQSDIDQATSLAKQLNQIGVPKRVVMAVANQDPAGLSDLYNVVNEARAKGVPITKEFMEDLVEIGGDFKEPEEDYNTFFRRILDPVANNVKADPEAFERDRKGSIWATMMGHNAMDRAQQKLETTNIDGMSAADLLKYGDESFRGKPLGDITVTMNPAAMPNKASLSLQDIKFLSSEVETITSSTKTKLAESTDENGNLLYDTSDPTSVKKLEQDAAQLAAQELLEKYKDVPGAVDYIVKIFGGEQEATPVAPSEPIVEEVLPPNPQQLQEAGIPVPTPPPAPVEEVEDQEPMTDTELYAAEATLNDNMRDQGKSVTLYLDADRNIVMEDQDGNTTILTAAQIREYVRANRG